MSKSVLISIRPQWCDLIASGKKTIEVRKTRPKLETPFKCYVYQTMTGYVSKSKENDVLIPTTYGKVIGEFMCDHIYQYTASEGNRDGADISNADMEKMSCLGLDELIKYEIGSNPDEGMGLAGLYGWHISDLVIYDKPKELSEFMCESNQTFDSPQLTPLKRPPQSWCYVEELK